MQSSNICRTTTGWLTPKGKIYLVNLPIVLDVPALKNTELYAHKALFGKGWTVTEKLTGEAVGRGGTKKQAIENAQKKILKAGNDKLSELIKLYAAKPRR